MNAPQWYVTHRLSVLFTFVVLLCHTLKFDVHCSCQLPGGGGGGCSLQQMYGWVCPTRYYPMGRGHGPIYNSHCPAKVWASNNVTPVYHATSPLHLTHPEDDISNVYHNRVTSTHDTSELQKSKLHITYLFEFPIKKYTLNPIYNE